MDIFDRSPQKEVWDLANRAGAITQERCRRDSDFAFRTDGRKRRLLVIMKAPRRPRLGVIYFSAHSRCSELSPGKITAVSAADQNIANNDDHAWPQIMNDSMGGDPVLPSGNFSFVIGASLRAASIRTGRKQIRVPTLSDMMRDGRTWKRRDGNCMVHES
jgi:hypothetical protein